MKNFGEIITSQANHIQKVIDFDSKTDKLYQLDFTASNTELTPEILSDTDLFINWVNTKLHDNHATYGIGGYNEHRTIYARSEHFNAAEEPRRLHLGVDIWAPARTAIYNFYDAKVHSFANNNNFGDYGATIILTYEIENITFQVLYGHLSLASLTGLEEGMMIPAGSKIAELGIKEENGFWPPHLHMQVILDMQGLKGDFPGVCRFSARTSYLANCPDPNLILKYTFG